MNEVEKAPIRKFGRRVKEVVKGAVGSVIVFLRKIDANPYDDPNSKETIEWNEADAKWQEHRRQLLSIEDKKEVFIQAVEDHNIIPIGFPQYSLGEAANRARITEEQLASLYHSILTNSLLGEPEAVGFARIVFELPVLNRGNIAEGLQRLAENGFQTDEKFIARVRTITEEKWRRPSSHSKDVEKGALTGGLFLKDELPDQTAEIKSGFYHFIKDELPPTIRNQYEQQFPQSPSLPTASK